MSLVIDMLRTSTVTDELSDSEVQIIHGLFDVQEYKSGEVIVQPEDVQSNSLYILAHGDIEVKIESGEGESIIHVLKPGDLAGMIAFVGGAAEQIRATLYAVTTRDASSIKAIKKVFFHCPSACLMAGPYMVSACHN